MASLCLGVGVFVARSTPRSPLPEGFAEKTAERLEVVDGPGPETAPPEGALNVVLVIACTLRKDQTPLHDPDLDTMPFLRSLADRGAQLEDLITAAPWTKAASTAILTSRHALEVGMVEPGPRRNERVLPTEVLTLAERFRRAGYRTVGGTANPNLHSTYGFQRGFQRYWEPRRDWHGTGGVKLPGRGIAELVVTELDGGEADRPYYLQVLFVDAHAPFPPAAPAADGVPQLVADYRHGLARLDEAIAYLAGQLDERGLLHNTLFVVVNDHGEGLLHPASHGKSHGRYLSPSTVGGVGVFAGPGIPAGHRVEGVASQVDLSPTIWRLAGLPPQEDFGGQDLSAAVRGETPRTSRERAYTDTWFRKVNRGAFYEDGRACQLAEDQGLTDRNGVTFVPGCFDRHDDPDHLRPSPEPEALASLAAWRRSAIARGTSFVVGRSEASEGLDQQLEALGYVD